MAGIYMCLVKQGGEHYVVKYTEDQKLAVLAVLCKWAVNDDLSFSFIDAFTGARTLFPNGMQKEELFAILGSFLSPGDSFDPDRLEF